MTFEEAKKVAEVLNTADYYCPFCVRDLCHKISKKFPEYMWEYFDSEIVVRSK